MYKVNEVELCLNSLRHVYKVEEIRYLDLEFYIYYA